VTPGRDFERPGGTTDHGSDLERQVRELADQIKDPCSLATDLPLGLEEMGLVEGVEVGPDGDVAIAIRLTSPTCVMVGYFRDELRRLVGELPGVRDVEVSFDRGLDWDPSMMSPRVRRLRAERLRVRMGLGS
jgi:metal-sulfur cluster biosynthetic enzyme